MNNSGVIEANGTSASAVVASTGNANITNVGTILATGAGGIGIFANTTAAVNNLTGSTITGGAFGIKANTVNVTANAGKIEATAAGGTAIFAQFDADVNNSGVVEANGDQSFAIAAAVGNANITNVGTIFKQRARAIGIGIAANTTAVVNNLTGGTITSGQLGIVAGTLDVHKCPRGDHQKRHPWYPRFRHREERGHDRGRKHTR